MNMFSARSSNRMLDRRPSSVGKDPVSSLLNSSNLRRTTTRNVWLAASFLFLIVNKHDPMSLPNQFDEIPNLGRHSTREVTEPSIDLFNVHQVE